MKNQTNNKDEQQVKNQLELMNLEPIIIKILDKEDGMGWSLSKAQVVSTAYKRFLFLCWKYGNDHTIVPSSDVDKFWHHHILDTRKYLNDCMEIFGHFIHHFPYFGMRGPDDAQNLQLCFETTKQLLRTEFPDDTSQVWSVSTRTCDDCGSSDCTACGSGGKVIKAHLRPTFADMGIS